MKRILLVMVIVLNSLLLFYGRPCEATTVTLNPQYDNAVMSGGLDTRKQDIVYQNSTLPVGCNWLCASFQDFTQDFTCFASLVRFDVSSLAGKTISNATLRLKVRNPGVGNSPRNWTIQAIYTPWNPNTVTWNVVMRFQYYTNSKITQPPPASSGGTYDIDVTSIVRAWTNGSWINNGLQFGSESYTFPPVCSTSYDYFEFYSLEDPAGQWPKLVVTYEEGPRCPTPGTPSGDPTPSNGFTGISTKPTLSWAPCANTDSYDVYFGTAKNAPLVVNAPYPIYMPQLNKNTTYYWRIVAKNRCGNSTSGPIWSFTTGVTPCPTPGTPSTPTPTNGDTGVSTRPTLKWAGGANTDSYDVYLGTSRNAPLVLYKTSNTSYSAPLLNNNTIYYWMVAAKNKCANSTPGPVWSFTTRSTP